MSDNLTEHAKRILELYQDKSKDFQKYFAILVGISLFLLLFMLLPFVSTQQARHLVIQNMENTSKAINVYNMTILHYKDALNGIKSLHTQIKSGPEILRNFILNLEKNKTTLSSAQPQTTQGPLPQIEFNQCKSLANTESWIVCNVNSKVQSQFKNYTQILNKSVIEPLQTLDNKSKESIGLPALINGTHDLYIKLNQTLLTILISGKLLRRNWDFLLSLIQK